MLIFDWLRCFEIAKKKVTFWEQFFVIMFATKFKTVKLKEMANIVWNYIKRYSE